MLDAGRNRGYPPSLLCAVVVGRPDRRTTTVPHHQPSSLPSTCCQALRVMRVLPRVAGGTGAMRALPATPALLGAAWVGWHGVVLRVVVVMRGGGGCGWWCGGTWCCVCCVCCVCCWCMGVLRGGCVWCVWWPRLESPAGVGLLRTASRATRGLAPVAGGPLAMRVMPALPGRSGPCL